MAARKNPPPKKLLTDAQIGELRRMAKVGLSQEHVALIFQMDRTTLSARMTDQDGVGAAWEAGKAEAADKVLTGLWRLIEDGVPSAIFFYCKTQLGWRETKVIEGGMTIEHLLAELDDEEDGDADGGDEPQPG